MKAAVLHQLGTNPRYEDFTDPIAANAQEVLVNVKASSIKQLDRSKASGKHYTSYPQLPVVVGFDGAGMLADGTRIYAIGLSGMMAEKAIVQKDNWCVLPDNIDFATAAALPNALIGSDVALLYRAHIKAGDTVLVNGATGVSGKVAVQMARHRGAKTVIATGRSAEGLEKAKQLGADVVVSLKDSDENIVQQLKKIQENTPIDIVLDYLWGHPMELILTAFKTAQPRKVKIVTIGEMAGASITIPSGLLRSTQIEILGSGIGSVPMSDIGQYLKETLPAVFELAASGKLAIDLNTISLQDIENTWSQADDPGKRTVVLM